MMIITFMCAFLAGPLTAAPATQPSLESLCDSALRPAGLSTRTARLDSAFRKLWDAGEFVLPFAEVCLTDPWRLPFVVDSLAVKPLIAADAQEDVAAMVEACGKLLNEGTRRRLSGDPIAPFVEKSKQPGALASAVRAIYEQAHVAVPNNVEKQLKDAELAPAIVREQAAMLLFASIDSRKLRDGAIHDVPNLKEAFAWQAVPASSDAQPGPDVTTPAIMNKIDYRGLIAGGTDLTIAAQTAMRTLRSTAATQPVIARDFHWDISTPWGNVALNGVKSDTYPAGAYLLIIDAGGDDTYFGGAATTSIDNAISIVIDLAGNDKYVYKQSATTQPIADDPTRKQSSGGLGAGGALFGYAILIDVEGNDLYRSTAPAQGSAQFGVGVLADFGGDDVYDGYVQAQGAAMFGIGLLYDRSGQDIYSAFTLSQGCGMTHGGALLFDRAGNDQYIANNKTIDFASAQSPTDNSSLAQGCGFGRRADLSDGKSIGGGVGMLIDLAGDDIYSGGVFSQGVGYWCGVGILVDRAGKDSYNGIWYAQGASAHSGVGYLEDDSGDDTYRATRNMAQGAGHDLGIGFLLDRGGNDHYFAPSLALGGGNAAAIGIFIDLDGNDAYEVTANATNLGQANTSDDGLFPRAMCLGVFIDAGGTDTYPAATSFARNGTGWTNWKRKNDRPEESQLGVGSDR